MFSLNSGEETICFRIHIHRFRRNVHLSTAEQGKFGVSVKGPYQKQFCGYRPLEKKSILELACCCLGRTSIDRSALIVSATMGRASSRLDSHTPRVSAGCGHGSGSKSCVVWFAMTDHSLGSGTCWKLDRILLW